MARFIQRSFVPLLTVGWLLPTSGAAAVLPVPGTFPTIQSAIDAAQNGDTVAVASGTYVERIDFKGKAITVRGTNGAAVTTIDGAGLGTVVTFATSEGALSRLEGFTIKNGLTASYGGGVRCAQASPTISACIVTMNSAVRGAGVSLEGSSAALTGCTIEQNDTGFVPGSRGGGVYATSPGATLVDCTITGNTAFTYGGGVYGAGELEGCTISGNAAAYGGGAYASPPSGTLIMNDCIVSQNQAGSPGSNSAGGGVYGPAALSGCSVIDNAAFDYGGGVFGDAVLTDCVLAGNEVKALKSFVSVGGAASGATLVRCLVSANTATGTVGVESRAGGLHGGSATSCVVVGNSASYGGGVVDTVLQGCTVHGNTASTLGGGVYGSGDVTDSIVWANTPQQISGTGTVTYSDVQGGHPGVGNVSLAPAFQDEAGGDLRLAASSPLIDLGDPTFAPDPGDPYDHQGFGHPRLMDGDLDGAPRVDMGAFEFGGLRGPLAVQVGNNLPLDVTGPPGGQYLVWLGLPGAALSLGPQVTLFLDPSNLIVLTVAALPAGGTVTALDVPIPAAAAGYEAHFQAATQGGSFLRFTNLEVTLLLP